MASANKIRLNETKPSSSKKQVHKFVLDDYDATYKLAIRILRGLCLKLTDEEESKAFSTIRNMIFWFMMVNVLTAAVLESICMMMTGSGGTLVELFTMMPCVGYLLVSTYTWE
ncbi:unnamed protein product [Danaus chrysippus]|uniref:(African queen) hypothetical protein n=1 Tax=Danaus chrysippus TaxID=151541 RepID=A0A8J2VWE6_9NEOP|nr:unnamed protein product [Danaus chrysippus]